MTTRRPLALTAITLIAFLWTNVPATYAYGFGHGCYRGSCYRGYGYGGFFPGLGLGLGLGYGLGYGYGGYGYGYGYPPVVVAAPPTVIVGAAPAASLYAPPPAAPPPAGYAPQPAAPSQPPAAPPQPLPLPNAVPGELGQSLQQLNDPSERVRIDATMQLGRNHVQQAVPSLTRLLSSDSSAQVREAAARSLGLIASPESLSALQDAAQADDDRDVRHSAQFAAEIIRTNLRPR